MIKLLLASILVVAMSASAMAEIWVDPSANQISPNAFWDSYYAVQNGAISAQIARNNAINEAYINELRAQRGAPPCSATLLRALIQGRPVC